MKYLFSGSSRKKSATACNRQRSGFTLVQMVVSLAIVALLSTGVAFQFKEGRAAAHQAACNANLKGIALALDSYREENRLFPEKLGVLSEKRYLQDMGALHCPNDPDPYGTYEDFYVQRSYQDPRALPALACPHHEKRNRGTQVYLDRQVEQFATKPSILTAASNATIQRPGETAVTAISGIELHGADTITTGPGGSALITFPDSSTALLEGDTKLTILQSFVEGRSQSLIYTLVRQASGTIKYQVHTGSKFDVATPNAVCGALGTTFTITVVPASAGGPQTKILVTEGRVRISTAKRSALAPLNSLYTITNSDLSLTALPSVNSDTLLSGGGLLGGGGVLTP